MCNVTIENVFFIQNVMPASQVHANMGVLARILQVVINALAKIITLEKTVKVSSTMAALIL